MALNVNIKGGGGLNKLKLQVLMNKLGAAVVSIITLRTWKGIDVDGKAWKGYNKQYARKREKAKLPTHPVTLIWDDVSGMMQSIEHEVFNNYKSVAVEINKPFKRQLAIWHSIEGAGRSRVIRRFWGLSKEEINEIYKLAKDSAIDLAKEFSKERLIKILESLQTNKR